MPNRRSGARLYAKHLAISWPSLSVAALAIALLLDRTPATFLFSIPDCSPWFAGYALPGAAVGFWLNRRHQTGVALWVWLPALLVFASNALADLRYAGWGYVWIAEFSGRCQASECLGELIGTVPLITCVTYALGAWSSLFVNGPRRGE